MGPTDDRVNTLIDALPTPASAHDLDAPTANAGLASRAVTAVVACALGAMVLLPVAQTFVRTVLRGDIPSATPLTQHLTLWVGFLGAVLATIFGKHLSLSTVNLLPAGRVRLGAEVFANAIATAVTFVLAVGALQMVRADRGSSSILTGGIPVWWSEVVMPATLLLMSAQFAFRAPGGWAGRAVSVLFAVAAASLSLLSPEHAAQAVWPVALLIGTGFLLGVPVFAAMAGLAMLMFFGEGTGIAAVPTSTFQLVTNPTLPAVPLLTVAGYVLAAGGASKRLVTAYRALLGWLPGGMALMALSVCALFTTFTGASGVTILAMGGVIFPSLIEEKYPEGFSLGLVTAAGSLGLLFPPSLPVILYGVVAEADIKKLFLAGLVPGVLIILLVAPYAIYTGVKSGAPRHKFVPREALAALWQAKWDLGLPILVITTIATGITTIVESAAMAALYSVLVEVVIFRNIHPVRDLPRVMGSAATLVGAVMILLGVALGLTAYLVDAQIPDALLTWVQAHFHTAGGFLLALNVILLVLGSVLEMYSAIVVIAPLVAPLGRAFGIDPVHLGVVFLANLELGFLLPPMGLNLFLSATRFQKPLTQVYRRAFPFLLIMSAGVLIVTYVPSLTTGMLAVFGVK